MTQISKNHSDFIRLWTSASSANNYNKQSWLDVERQLIESGSLKSESNLSKFNPFLCKSEGMRRLTIALASIAYIVWVVSVFILSNGFTTDGVYDSTNTIIFVIVIPLIVYLVIVSLYVIGQWVLRGFRFSSGA
jgi:hypothetical protein